MPVAPRPLSFNQLRAARMGHYVRPVFPIDPAAAKRTQSAVTATGGRAIAVCCDVAHLRKSGMLLRLLQKRFDSELLVNTAAVDDPSGDAVALDEADWNRALADNLTGAFLFCKHGIPS